VDSYAALRAGPVTVRWFVGPPANELLAVFRDDMQVTRHVPAQRFLRHRDFLRELRGAPGLGGQEIKVTEFRAPGRAVAARLDLLGVDEDSVRAALAGQLGQPRAAERAETAESPEESRRLMFPRTRRRLEEAEDYLRAEAEGGCAACVDGRRRVGEDARVLT
jgi:hypothetical protein